jgi:iron transport multicopper oxidase
LVYDDQKEFPAAKDVPEFDDFDDFNLVPEDKMDRLPKANLEVNLTLSMQNLRDGANYAMFNDETYVVPKVPTLYSALSLGEAATNPAVYGVNSNAFMLEKGQVVDIIVNNNDPGKHPLHLHGHNFQVISRSDDDAGYFLGNVTEDSFPNTPMRRDVILVRPAGYVVIRFVADNPGIWLFHCHIEWLVDR